MAGLSWSALCQYDLGGGDHLTGVSLGVFGAVDEQACDGAGQAVAAYAAGELVGGCRDGADSGHRAGHAVAELLEELVAGAGRRHLGGEGGALEFAELVVFGVGEQAVEAASHVAKLEADRWKVEGTGFELFVGQVRAPASRVLLGELKRMQDLASYGVDLVPRSS